MYLESEMTSVFIKTVEKFERSFEREVKNCEHNQKYLPVPIEKKGNVLVIGAFVCSFDCLESFVVKQRSEENIKFLYSFNIIFSILPWIVNSEHF